MPVTVYCKHILVLETLRYIKILVKYFTYSNKDKNSADEEYYIDSEAHAVYAESTFAKRKTFLSHWSWHQKRL